MLLQGSGAQAAVPSVRTKHCSPLLHVMPLQALGTQAAVPSERGTHCSPLLHVMLPQALLFGSHAQTAGLSFQRWPLLHCWVTLHSQTRFSPCPSSWRLHAELQDEWLKSPSSESSSSAEQVPAPGHDPPEPHAGAAAHAPR